MLSATELPGDADAVDDDGGVGSLEQSDSSRAPATPGEPSPRSIRIGANRYPVYLPRLRDPRLWVAGVTLSVHALGQVALHFQLSVPQLLSAMLTAFVIEVALTFRSRRAFVWPASALLTASGIALILRLPTTPLGDHWSFHQWYVYSAVTAFALLTKNLVRFRGAPLFNPSNLALVLVFLVFGSSRVEPLDFWWAPPTGAMIAAYVLIVVGGALITRHLRLLRGAVVFWLTLAAGTALVAAFGHCMTARWAFAPVCGFDYWRAIVTSPEVLIFTFFMITDPKTVPRGRVGHSVFCAMVAIACVLLMAPQTSEFWTKVGLLGGLTAMCAARPLIELLLPERDSPVDRFSNFFGVLVGRGLRSRWARGLRYSLLGLVVLAVPTGVIAAGLPARGTPVQGAHELLNRVLSQVDPSTLPTVSVDGSVTDWNHEITHEGAQQLVLELVENLEIESQALLHNDPSILTIVDHGDRLDDLRGQLAAAQQSGVTEVRSYQIKSAHLTLLVPFGRQDGLSLGVQTRGTVTIRVVHRDGSPDTVTTESFAIEFAMRRATGDRWLNVAALPMDA